MNPQNTIETTGETIEEAIQQGIEALGVRSIDVIVEVIDEPVPSMFGLEAKPARVRLQVMSRPMPEMPPPPPYVPPPPIEFTVPTYTPEPEPTPARPPRPTPSPDRAESRDRAPQAERKDRLPTGDRASRPPASGERRADDRPRREARPDRPARPPRDNDAPRGEQQGVPVFDEEDGLPLIADLIEIPENEHDDEVQIAKVVLNELLTYMGFSGRIVVRRAQPDEQDAPPPWILDIHDVTMSHLVGRKGETLAALQYIARLIVSRQIERRTELILDVESYKARRAKALHALAMRMADDAVARGQTMTLEPMPPHERRIVHLALRQRPDVDTKSVGEGSSRKVTIVPKSVS